jgi:hypothetical protein
MKKNGPALIVLFLALMVFVFANAAIRWRDVPLHDDTCVRSGSCASCHQGSIPNNHTVEFLEESHGSVARTNRESCMTCHEQRQCADCHDNEMPAWHNLLLCRPARGEKERNAHMHIANQHRQSCMECHSRQFQTQCSNCHIMDEWKR